MTNRYISIIAITSVLLFSSCDKSEGQKGHGSWKLSTVTPGEITVTSSGKDVERYEFTTDSDRRISGMKRVDLLGGQTLIDVKYSYGGSQVGISGIISATKGAIDVTDGKNGMDYTAQDRQSWTYHVDIAKDGLPTAMVANDAFSATAGKLANETAYAEAYTIQNGDICQMTAGTVVKGDSKLKTQAFAESALTTVYSYIVNEDRQNFCALLMDCALPVWYARGLPGCKHLISDIEVFGGGLDYREKQHIDYRFDDDGNILEATRTWSSGGEKYLTMTYTFSY